MTPPDRLATQQAQLNTLNATATVQAVSSVADPSDHNEGSFIDSIVNWLRDPVFQGLSCIVGVLGLFATIYGLRER